MRLSIRHQTVYRYSGPVAYSIQQLRLTPRLEGQQRVASWQIDTPGQCHAYADAYGNLSRMMTTNDAHEGMTILAHGVVDTGAIVGGRLDNVESLSPLVFTVPTRLTEPTTAINALAAACLPQGQATTAQLICLAEHIIGAVQYQTGATMVTTSADDALRLGRGVCQDHAHLFLACCHARGIAARYVSGYIDPETTSHAASHAWIDAWTSDADFTGWVSIDVTHARPMTPAYVRLAIGRDYDGAAPIRGVRRGGGDETMQVSVTIAVLP